MVKRKEIVNRINNSRNLGLSDQEILEELHAAYPKCRSIEAYLYGTTTDESILKYKFLNNTTIFFILTLLVVDAFCMFNIKLLLIIFLLGWIIFEIYKFNGTVYIQSAFGIISSQIFVLTSVNDHRFALPIMVIAIVNAVLIFYLMQRLFPKYKLLFKNYPGFYKRIQE